MRRRGPDARARRRGRDQRRSGWLQRSQTRSEDGTRGRGPAQPDFAEPRPRMCRPGRSGPSWGMTSDSALPPVIGAIATDRDGNALGTITTVFLDDVTERPTWVGLSDGLHASPDETPVIAPLADARFSEGRLVLPVPADAVRSAPPVSRPDRLSPEEETLLRDHYAGPVGVTGPATGTGTGPRTGTGTDADVRPGTTTDGAMTRTEEQLQ